MDRQDYLRRIRALKREVEELAQEYGVLEDEDDEWQEFISEHPELTERPRLEFTDDEVYDAVVEIAANDPMETHNWPHAAGVRRLLMYRKGLNHLPFDSWSHSDLMRVVAALKRLEKTGRVVQ